MMQEWCAACNTELSPMRARLVNLCVRLLHNDNEFLHRMKELYEQSTRRTNK